MQQAKTHDIYPYLKNLETAEAMFQARAERYGIDTQSIDLLKEYIEYHIETKGLKIGTKVKHLYDFATILEFTDKPILEHREPDMIQLCKRIRESPRHAEFTKQDYFRKLKAFFRWLKIQIRKGRVTAGNELLDGIEYLLEEHKFRLNKDKLPKASYLTEKDMITLIDSTTEMREKALLSLLWASGCRIGEVLTLRIGDVKPLSNGLRSQGFKIELRKSKTTERTIPVLDERRINARRYLHVWLKYRQRSGAGDEDALFVNIHGEPLEYRAAKKQLDKVAALSNLGKRAHFHAIRKGRATDLAEKGWKEAQMNQLMGWKHGSNMPSVYIQRAGVDVTKRMAQDYGLVDIEESDKEYLICSGCGTENDLDKEYCVLCNQPVGENALEALRRYEDEAIKMRERDILALIRHELGLRTNAATGEK